jgi:hypothetical protein
MRSLLRVGFGLQGVAVPSIRCPPHSVPGFRHPAIRPSEPTPNISPKQGSLAPLPPPLLMKPGCLFDESLHSLYCTPDCSPGNGNSAP